MTSFRTGRASIVLFFILTYALSWFLFWFGQAQGSMLITISGVWGPSLISLLLTLVMFGPGGVWRLLKRFGLWRAPIWLWACLLGMPAAIHFAGRSAWQIGSGAGFDPSILPFEYWPMAILPAFIIAALGEELGWRGFALPRLQRVISPLKAAIILGLVHALWHLPTYWLGTGTHNVPAIWLLLFVTPWTIIGVWFYNRSGGSLLFSAGFHGITNASLSIVQFMPGDGAVPITPELLTRLTLPAELAGPYLSVLAAYWIVALTIIVSGGLKPASIEIN
jgi:uncharacterized protein